MTLRTKVSATLIVLVSAAMIVLGVIAFGINSTAAPADTKKNVEKAVWVPPPPRPDPTAT